MSNWQGKIGIGLLSFLTSGALLARTDCRIGKISVNPDDGNQLAGKTGILICRDEASGELRGERELRNGRFIGRQKIQDFQGNWIEQTVDANGNPDGERIVKTPEGRLVEVGHYVKGKARGVFETYYDNGKLQLATFQEDEKTVSRVEYTRDGLLYDIQCGAKFAIPSMKALCGFDGKPSEVKLYARGKVRATVVFLKGQPVNSEKLDAEGKVIEQQSAPVGSKDVVYENKYFKDGKLQLVSAYRKGRLDGPQKEYHRTGKLIRETVWHGGEASEETTYFLNGKPETSFKRELKQGRDLFHYITYFDNGQIASDCFYVNADIDETWGFGYAFRATMQKKHGPCVDYYRSGKVMGRGAFLNGEAIGQHERFDEQGRLAERDWYEKGTLSRRQIWEPSTGTLRQDEEYFEDGSLKRDLLPEAKSDEA